MTRLRRIALTVVVGVLVTLPTAGVELTDFAVDRGKSVLTGTVWVEGAGPTSVVGSSHRESPRIMLDPAADS